MIDQLSGIRCLSAAVARKANKEVDVLSCPDAIARALEAFLGDAVSDPVASKPATGRACPRCQQPLRREAGCLVCDRCYYSTCG